VLRSGEPALLLVGGCALREEPLVLAGRIAEASGAKLMAETFNARIERGAGRVATERIPYPIDQALGALNGVRHLILIGAKPPVAFFAYPGKPSRLSPDDAEIHVLAERRQDVAQALEGLADEIGARCKAAAFAPLAIPAPAGGPITPVSLGLSIAALLPENAIVVDEAITTGRSFFAASRCSRPHDWLQNMGGSIGFGMPQAAGAAVACPGRRVVSLEGDGSAMYTVQALWTQAREGLDVTTLLFSNRSYAILQHELANIGAQPAGRKTLDMLDIGRPDLDWAAISRGMGVPASRAETMEAFNTQFADALKTPGPSLIEVMLRA
jgi:acetolactate synthase I/II/III large subunit